MKYLIFISLIFVGCTGSKVISEQSDTVKTIEVNSRAIPVKFDKMGTFDTTDLDLLKRGLVITKQDKKTGIKTSYQIKDNNLLSSIEVPEQIKIIEVADTTTTIKTNTVTVKEKKPGFWDQVQEKFNTIIFALVAIVVLIVVFKIFY